MPIRVEHHERCSGWRFRSEMCERKIDPIRRELPSHRTPMIVLAQARHQAYLGARPLGGDGLVCALPSEGLHKLPICDRLSAAWESRKPYDHVYIRAADDEYFLHLVTCQIWQAPLRRSP